MQLTHSLLSGLTPSGATKSGREAASPTDAGKPGGDFSGLLSLLSPKAAVAETAQTSEGDSAPLPAEQPETAAPAGAATLASGSAMPPVAASGKILPVSLPEGLPVGDKAAEAEPKAEVADTLPKNADAPEATAPAEGPDVTKAVLTIATKAAAKEAGTTTESESETATVAEPEDSTKPAATHPDQPSEKVALIVPAPPIPAGIAASIETKPTEEPVKAKGTKAQPKTVTALSAATLPLPVAANAAPGSEKGAEGQAAASLAPAQPAIAGQASSDAETGAEGQRLATPAKGPEAAPASNAAAPTLTLRMAQREEAPQPAAETRPATAERQTIAASTTLTPRFAPVSQAEIERPRLPAAPAAINPSAPAAAAPIASAPADAAPAAPVFRAPAPAQEPMADLAQIVDRLAAAREAVAPARAALSIDHAEFGELTLRFEQRHDGRLTAELAGANAEAHRAVSHALAADRSQTAGHDSGTSQQHQQQSSAQTARASTGDRDASGSGGNAQDQRQDTARQRGGRPGQQARPQGGGNTQQNGVFA